MCLAICIVIPRNTFLFCFVGILLYSAREGTNGLRWRSKGFNIEYNFSPSSLLMLVDLSFLKYSRLRSITPASVMASESSLQHAEADNPMSTTATAEWSGLVSSLILISGESHFSFKLRCIENGYYTFFFLTSLSFSKGRICFSLPALSVIFLEDLKSFLLYLIVSSKGKGL